MQDKVRNAINELVTLDNPTSVGTYKPRLRSFAYELGRSYRIIYNVRFSDYVIELIRVGDHKQAYGKD